VHWASNISQGGLEVSFLNLSDLTAVEPSQTSYLLTPELSVGPSLPETNVPPHLTEHVKLLVGTVGTSLAFLDHEGWLSTWDLTTPSDPQKSCSSTAQTGTVHRSRSTVECDIEGIPGLTRHFFAPRDWLNTNTSHLTTLDDHGTLFCPRYGEVAIVRNGMRL
jgi:hypothetical protein